MRGEVCTQEELRRRSASCQRQRQKLLRTALENSTSQWAQRVYNAPCRLPELAHHWRQQTGGAGDFEQFAQGVVRSSRARLRTPPETSVGKSRRSASEPRHGQPTQAAAAAAPPPGHRKRRHSIALPLLPAAIYGPFLYVAHPVAQPIVYARVAADDINRSQMHKSDEQRMQQGHCGAHASVPADQITGTQIQKSGGKPMQQGYSVKGMQPIHVVPAVPIYFLCNVAIPVEKQRAAPPDGAPGQSRGEPAEKSRQTEARHPVERTDPRRHSLHGHVAPPPASESKRSRTRSLPGNFAELEKTWYCNAGAPIKLPFRNIRL